MLETSFSLLYFLKQPKNPAIKKRYVYCRITVKGVQVEFTTKRTCELGCWDQKNECMTGKSQDARSLNGFLESITSSIYRIRKELLDNDIAITATVLKNRLLGVDEKKYLIMEIYDQYNATARKLVGIDYAKDTVDRFERTARYVREYIKEKYQVEDMELKQLDYDFVKGLSEWLKIQKNCQNNTTVKFITTFKTVVLDCVKRNWLKSDPFALFSMKKVEVEVEPLTSAELAKMRSKNLHCERLMHVRDIFIFSCYTGLAYADVKRLSWTNIQKSMEGEWWLRIRRKKTGTPCSVLLLPEAREILYRYGIKQSVRRKGVALPVPSNQKMNAYLTEIGELCGFTRQPTTHTARHTFATTVALANGISMETVSRMLGHKSIRQTQHYGKVVDMKIANEMKMLRNTLRNVQ
ncbi:site-specific integrase [Chitinophaga barathri]|uniref:Site-specific integrase n=1 Tax=Chitinophaga barathri TaxID=1647451 RepID=A0A3N4M7N3_9BACT|nr:site-specific integrase [Chitinophaga barathri]RPD39298.1 site-specific integrase [Chitinophaga barathri]